MLRNASRTKRKKAVIKHLTLEQTAIKLTQRFEENELLTT